MRFPLAMSVIALAASVAVAPKSIANRTGTAIPLRNRSPSPFTNPDKTVNFDAHDAYVASVKAKMHRAFVNYEQNTGLNHPLAVLLNGSQRRGNGELLTEYGDGIEWYGEISAGTPPQTFTVHIDTGSADIVIPTTFCSSCGNHHLFDPKATSSGGKLTRTFDITYGDGSSASGNLYIDTMSIAGYTADVHFFSGASAYSLDLRNSVPDGIMGMGFRSISANDIQAIVETLKYEKKLSEAVFSVKMASAGSELYLGGVNPNLYTGEFTYVSVTHQGFWQVKMDNIQSDSQTILTNLDAVIDTGTSFIGGPPSDVSTLYSALGGSPVPYKPGYYSIPCAEDVNLHFTFGGKSWWIIPWDFNRGPIYYGSSDCLGAVFAIEDIKFWLVGDTFLRSVYSTFDYGHSRVGFATLA